MRVTLTVWNELRLATANLYRDVVLLHCNGLLVLLGATPSPHCNCKRQEYTQHVCTNVTGTACHDGRMAEWSGFQIDGIQMPASSLPHTLIQQNVNR